MKIYCDTDKEVVNFLPMITLDTYAKGVVIGWLIFYISITKK